MNNNKQSSVEWLSNQTYELFEQYSEGNFDRITLNKLVLKATEQAKAMHKDEMEHFFKRGMFLVEGHLWKPTDKFEENYNETYGGNK